MDGHVCPLLESSLLLWHVVSNPIDIPGELVSRPGHLIDILEYTGILQHHGDQIVQPNNGELLPAPHTVKQLSQEGIALGPHHAALELIHLIIDEGDHI